MKQKSHYKHCIRKLGELTGYKNNPRLHSNAQIDQLVESIKVFGFTNPILIDPKNNIIAGHGRLEAATKAGLENVTCVVIDGLTKTQQRALIIADNQLALNADWDIELLMQEIDELESEDFDISLLGFDPDFLAAAVEGPPEDFGDIDEIDLSNTCPKCGFEYD